MVFKKYPIIAVEVFLEKRSARKRVGVLEKSPEGFVFIYDEDYLRAKNVIPLGPEMPLTRKTYTSKKLFTPFQERIPPRENPAYSEYCKSVGIAIDEKDPMVLLATIGHKGPSSFIFEPVYEIEFTSKDLREFRKFLSMSIREFAECFDFSQGGIAKAEKGILSGLEIFKRVAIYARYPQVALDQIRLKGGVLHGEKRKKIEKILREKICEKNEI